MHSRNKATNTVALNFYVHAGKILLHRQMVIVTYAIVRDILALHFLMIHYFALLKKSTSNI